MDILFFAYLLLFISLTGIHFKIWIESDDKNLLSNT